MSVRSTVAKYLRRNIPYHVGSVASNVAGLQVVRAATKYLAWQLRTAGGADDAHAATLVEDGIVVIRDFLPTTAAAAVRAEFERSRVSHKYVRDYDYAHLVPAEAYADPTLLADKPLVFEDALRIDTLATAFPATFEHVRNHPSIRSIVAAAARRRVRDCFASFTVWQRFTGTATQVDRQRIKPRGEYMLHADTHYPTFKAWYYIDDIDADNGAFVYVRRSHKMTLDRLGYEYDASVRVAKAKRDGSWLSLPYGHIRSVPPELLVKMGVHEDVIAAPANSLVIADTCGFHRRGEFSSDRPRETLHLDFRQLRYYADI